LNKASFSPSHFGGICGDSLSLRGGEILSPRLSAFARTQTPQRHSGSIFLPEWRGLRCGRFLTGRLGGNAGGQ